MYSKAGMLPILSLPAITSLSTIEPTVYTKHAPKLLGHPV